MSVLFAWPAQLKLNDRGLALTFVVPASACDLRCKFCAIRQRAEAGPPALLPEDYSHFLRDLALTKPVAVASIQGYEPLLDESWPYTVAILSEARRLGVPSSLVTNGTNLARRAKELAALEPAGITVSIDSGTATEHDRLRGVPGTFAKVVAGLEDLMQYPYFAGRVTVSSVLMPKQPSLLFEVPSLLARVGVRTWVISPLLRIGDHSPGGVVGKSRQVVSDVRMLGEHAARVGVDLILDDELGELSEAARSYDQFIVRRFSRPDGLIRLGPTGACSTGTEILRRVGAYTPVWVPGEQSPREFVDRILGKDVHREEQLQPA